MPVLEAMSYGAPVIASNAASIAGSRRRRRLLRSARRRCARGGDCCALPATADTQTSLRRRGPPRAAAFTWERTASRTLEVIEDVITACLTTIHLATGIAIRDERLLLVASHYPNQPQPLWNLPGGRQQPGELLVETVVREFYEETQLRVHAGELAYVSESYDGDRHFLNATFLVELDVIEESPFDRLG